MARTFPTKGLIGLEQGFLIWSPQTLKGSLALVLFREGVHSTKNVKNPWIGLSVLHDIIKIFLKKLTILKMSRTFILHNQADELQTDWKKK